MGIRATKPISEYSQAVFEDHLFRALDEYIPDVRKWYAEYYEHVFDLVGSNQIPDAKHGLWYRFYISPKHSTIKGLQAFPYVSVMQLNLPPAPGGVRIAVRTILGTDYYKYGDIYLILKQSLVNTNNAGQFIAFVTEEFFNQLPRGRYVWIPEEDITMLMRKVVSKQFHSKLMRWVTTEQRNKYMRSMMEVDGTYYVDEDEDKEPVDNFV